MNLFFHTYNFQTQTSKLVNPQQLASNLISKPLYLITLIIYLIINTSQAKETVIVQSIKTRNDKISLRLLDQIQNSIENERYINNFLYKCKYYLKNELTKNVAEKSQALDIELDYGKIATLFTPSSIGPNTPENIILAKRLDKILNILNGQCLYYSTSTFLYQYCHKEHVRQFDNTFTKVNNQKVEFEDISLGVFNLDEHKQKRIKMGIRQLTEEQRKTTIPVISNFAPFYNFLTVDGHDVRFGKFQLEQSSSGQLLYSSSSLISGGQDYIEHPKLLRISCFEQNSEIINFGFIVDPFTIAYSNKRAKCSKVTEIIEISHNIEFFKDSSLHPIRVYGKYLFGNIEKICTRNQAWSKNNQNAEFDNYLTDGSLILVELFSHSRNQIQVHFLKVKKVISPELIEVEVPIGTSFKWNSKNSAYFRSNNNLSQQISNISKCQILFKTPLDIEEDIAAKYISKNLLQISNKQQFKPGTNLGCIAKTVFGTFSKYIDFNVTISRSMSNNLYEIFKSTNTHILQIEKYYGREMILYGAENIRCLKQNQNNHVMEEKNEKLMDKIRLDNKNRFLNFSDGGQYNLYVISIRKYGIIKLITKNKEGYQCTYYLTEGQIIKVIQFSNGTKQITKQNKYYENSTVPNYNPLKNLIYFKIIKMPNGRLYGGIWKTGDIVFFPRFQLFDEEIICIERVSGNAFIRIFDLEKIRQKQSLSITRYAKILKDYFEMQERLSTDSSKTLFLDKSYSISYLYSSGTYCNLPVNKFRSTRVKLKCGAAWFQIVTLLQLSPCVYEIQIETRLLCRQGYKHIIETDEELINTGPHDVVVNNGIFCFSQKIRGLYDEVAALPHLAYYE